MAIRDFLRRLGLLSGDDAGSQRGVRRAGFPQRSTDAPTAPVQVPSMAPGSGAKPATPPPTEMVTPPRPAPAAPPPPVVQPPPAAASTPPNRDVGGATQYFKTVESEPQALVGVLVGVQGPLKGQIYKVHDGESKTLCPDNQRPVSTTKYRTVQSISSPIKSATLPTSPSLAET